MPEPPTVAPGGRVRFAWANGRGVPRKAGEAAGVVGLVAIAAPLMASSAYAQSDYVVHASSEFATYADSDHVFVQTPSVSGSVARPASGVSLTGTYLVDVVSAASVDIVSTASRRWSEVRQAGTLQAAFKPSTWGVAVSGAVSDEPDYVSWAAGAVLSRDLLEKNLTLSAGFDHRRDEAGRTGTPFSVFSRQFNADKLSLGASLVLDRATVGSALVDAEFVNGDSSETYRYIPLFAPGVAPSAGASVDTVNALRLSERASEQVPLSRSRYALTLRLAHRFHSATLRLEERLYDDTWGLLAQTADARLLFDLGRRVEWGPLARVHAQEGVHFWERAYVLRSGFNYPAYRTGDRELGPLVNMTGGGSVRVGVGPSGAPMKWNVLVTLQAIYSRYLDDLYLTDRSAGFGALSLEGEL